MKINRDLKKICDAPRDGTIIVGFAAGGGHALIYWSKRYSPKLGWSLAQSVSFWSKTPIAYVDVPKCI